MVVTDETGVQAAQANLDNLAKHLRIGALSEVILADGRTFATILKKSSMGADLIFLGMASPGETFMQSYEKLQHWTENLPTSIFVLAAPGFDFEGVLGET